MKEELRTVAVQAKVAADCLSGHCVGLTLNPKPNPELTLELHPKLNPKTLNAKPLCLEDFMGFYCRLLWWAVGLSRFAEFHEVSPAFIGSWPRDPKP